MLNFGEIIGSKLVNQLNTKCLTSLLLQESKGSKEQARENIAHLHEFRDKLKELSKDICFCPVFRM